MAGKSSSASSATSRLTSLVDSLQLSKGRFNASGSASVMTLGTMRSAGFTDVDHVPHNSEPSDTESPLLDPDSRCEYILDQLIELRGVYFENGLNLRIPVLDDEIVRSKITTLQDLVNALNLVAISYVHNNLGADSPFPSVGAPSIIPYYPNLGVNMLQNDPDATPDDLKDALSWFSGIFVNAEPQGDGKYSERSVEHLIGGPLHQLISIPSCHVVSGRRLNFPDILKLSVKKGADTKHSSEATTLKHSTEATIMEDDATQQDEYAESEDDSDDTYSPGQRARVGGKGKGRGSGRGRGAATPRVAKNLKTKVAAQDGRNSLSGVTYRTRAATKAPAQKNTFSEAHAEDRAEQGRPSKTAEPEKGKGKKAKTDVGDCFPDLLSQLSINEQGMRRYVGILRKLLQPVVIAGEAKRRATGDGRKPDESKKDYRVQLAMAVHPSLVLLILLHLDGKPFDVNTLGSAKLDKDYFIYSVYYDEEKLIVLAQFPYYYISPAGSSTSGWRFAQVKVAEIQIPTWPSALNDSVKDARSRAKFSIAMQAVREHGKVLSQKFLSPEYRELMEEICEDIGDDEYEELSEEELPDEGQE